MSGGCEREDLVLVLRSVSTDETLNLNHKRETSWGPANHLSDLAHNHLQTHIPLPTTSNHLQPTCVTMPREWPRGTMVALWMGLAPGVWIATMAWPLSWNAVRFRPCKFRIYIPCYSDLTEMNLQLRQSDPTLHHTLSILQTDLLLHVHARRPPPTLSTPRASFGQTCAPRPCVSCRRRSPAWPVRWSPCPPWRPAAPLR